MAASDQIVIAPRLSLNTAQSGLWLLIQMLREREFRRDPHHHAQIMGVRGIRTKAVESDGHTTSMECKQNNRGGSVRGRFRESV